MTDRAVPRMAKAVRLMEEMKMAVIVDKTSFKKLAAIVGIREAAEVAKAQGISLAVVQLWIRS